MKPLHVAVWLTALIGIFHLATIRSGHSWGDDFSLYILHAKNIIEGLPYAETGYLYNPDEPIAPPTYPPVFPMLLAVVYQWFGLNLTAMKVELILFFLASLLAIFAACRKLVEERLALALLAIVGLNPYFWMFKDEIGSDIPFLLFTFLGLLCITCAQETRSTRGRQARWALLAGVMILLAYGTRSVGLLLPAALVVTDLLRWKRPSWVTVLALVPLAGFLVVLPNAFRQESVYLDLLRRPFDLNWALMNWEYYTKELRDLWKNGYSGVMMRAVFLAMNGLALVGFWSRVRRGPTVWEVFPLLYTTVIFLWPYYQGIRFFIPVIPLYIFYALVGLDRLAERCGPRGRQVALRSLVAIALASYAARYTTLNFGPLDEGIEHPDSVELFDYLKHNTPPEAVCIFFKPRALALFTGRRAAKYHMTTDDAFLDDVDRIGADYIIVQDDFFQDRELLHPCVKRHPDRFEPVHANGDFVVYRVSRQG